MCASGSSPAFLIVDDQEILAEFMASMASDAGWTAEITCSAEDFENSIKRHHPDAIALDLRMPGRDGIELLRDLSSAGYAGKLIIVSGCEKSVVEATASLARHYGLDLVGYAQKPIMASEFSSLLSLAWPTTTGLSP